MTLSERLSTFAVAEDHVVFQRLLVAVLLSTDLTLELLLSGVYRHVSLVVGLRQKSSPAEFAVEFVCGLVHQLVVLQTLMVVKYSRTD